MINDWEKFPSTSRELKGWNGNARNFTFGTRWLPLLLIRVFFAVFENSSIIWFWRKWQGCFFIQSRFFTLLIRAQRSELSLSKCCWFFFLLYCAYFLFFPSAAERCTRLAEPRQAALDRLLLPQPRRKVWIKILLLLLYAQPFFSQRRKRQLQLASGQMVAQPFLLDDSDQPHGRQERYRSSHSTHQP